MKKSTLTLALAALNANQSDQPLGVAACSYEITNDSLAQQIMPAGKFRSSDGQSDKIADGYWYIDEAIAKKVIADRQSRHNDLLFDYEHQTLNSKENGKPAPAAGWAKNVDLEWVADKGLFIKNVEWTDAALKAIKAKEYRYISPVFSYNKKTGEVVSLRHIGITNDPAIDGMQDLIALKSTQSTNQPEQTMNQLLIELLAKAGIVIDPNAPPKDLAALTAMFDNEDAKTGIAALTAKLDSPNESETEVAALTAKVAELQKGISLSDYVPAATYAAVITEMAALKANHETVTVGQVIEQAQKDGKFIAQAELNYLKDLGNANLAALKANLDQRPVLGAFMGKQTTESKNPGEPDPNAQAALSADQTLIANQLGISHEDYAKTLQAEKAQA
ncbi:MAG: phage scaffold protein [Alteromonadaceae bacterium]|uniref:phage protease n=1 Tax=Paraglaciecola chathamensis TaxID=368405 RepID=UPI000C64F054|nr:phage protease [Paraglaciecola agarilytica]MBN26266.1 phage scaffold protein [Alteromonadaceae bacterium]|tara:strand:- start:93318 stop:94487 length:1170 start_codon:yes stop_codon:yes gene_type:complete